MQSITTAVGWAARLFFLLLIASAFTHNMYGQSYNDIETPKERLIKTTHLEGLHLKDSGQVLMVGYEKQRGPCFSIDQITKLGLPTRFKDSIILGLVGCPRGRFQTSNPAFHLSAHIDPSIIHRKLNYAKLVLNRSDSGKEKRVFFKYYQTSLSNTMYLHVNCKRCMSLSSFKMHKYTIYFYKLKNTPNGYISQYIGTTKIK